MLDFVLKAIQVTIKTGIGQTIIAFGAWFYVLILLVGVICYSFLSIIKLLFHKKQ